MVCDYSGDPIDFIEATSSDMLMGYREMTCLFCVSHSSCTWFQCSHQAESVSWRGAATVPPQTVPVYMVTCGPHLFEICFCKY